MMSSQTQQADQPRLGLRTLNSK